MKILFVCSSLSGGGAERVAVNLSNTFVNMGHSVNIFTRKNSAKSYSLDGRVAIISNENLGFIKSLACLKKIIDKDKYDVVFGVTDVPNIVAFLASVLSKNKSLYVPTVHTDLGARDSHLKQDLRFLLIRSLHRRACRSAFRVVGVSEGSRRSLVSYYGLEPKNTVTIYNPVLADEEPVALRKSQFPKREIKLVAAGRLTAAKNYHMMIDVVRRLNESSLFRYTLDIYGKGELAEELKSYSVAQGIEGHVSFKGFVDNLSSLLLDYDVFVFTSNWEGFGNVLVEALCSGIPVVATDCRSGPREILDNGRFGRITPVRDVDAFCCALKNEIEHPLEICYDELLGHLQKFRESFVAQQYIDLVYHANST